MAQQTVQKQWFQGLGNVAKTSDHPGSSTCHTSKGLRITVGDFVHVHPTDSHLGLYIARVERLYQDNSGKRCLYVRWYYRPADLQHRPPSFPEEQELYHTDYFDGQGVETVAGLCQVVMKADFLRLSKNESADAKGATYFCEYSYTAEKGAFTPVSMRDERPGDFVSSFKHLGGPSSRGTAAVAKELAEVLLGVERTIPKEILPIYWADCREAWVCTTKDAKTIKEVAQSLLDLAEGVRVLRDRKSQSAKDHSAWRKTVSGIHTYEQLAKHIKLFKQDVRHKVAKSVCNKAIRGIHNDQSLMKRKYIPDTEPKKQRKFDNVLEATSGESSLHDDLCLSSGLKEARPSVEGLLPRISEFSDIEVMAGNVYTINQECLPEEAPTTLKLIRAVLVAEKTRLHVTVKFPSDGSLQSYFGRTPSEIAINHTTMIANAFGEGQGRKETCMGTKPELDKKFIMTPKLAESVLNRLVSCTESLHQGHLWSFWVIDGPPETKIEDHLEPGRPSKRVPGSKGCADAPDHEDEEKGELGAAEALTQLIPGNTTLDVRAETRAVHSARNVVNSCGGPFRWGTRSLRKGNSGNRSGTGTSPNNCDTAAKDLRNTDREKVRKSLDYNSDQQQHQIGQVPIAHDLMQTERSSRWHSRREERVMDLGAAKCPPSSSKDKSGHSKHVRANILKLPKDMQGRWSSDRYKLAQIKLIEIMHERGAEPGKPILRPALREEARKYIGDTGLLDHLLKHMTDTVVSNGERFRRRHNAEGAMEYWLEDASLMEIRKAAGVEDPSWIPPPGWKTGDIIPGRGEYGYGGLNNRGMSPAEAAEMKKLKETVETLKSEIHSLSSRVKDPQSREVTPDSEAKEDIPQDVQEQERTKSASKFEEEMRDKVERIKMAVKEVRQDLHKLHNDQGQTQHDTGVGSTNAHSGVQIESVPNDEAGANFERLGKIEVQVQKLSEEGRVSYMNLAEGKNQLEADLSEVRNQLKEGRARYMNLAEGKKQLEVDLSEVRNQLEEGRARYMNLAEGRNQLEADFSRVKNQLEADLSEVQKSVAFMQEDIRCIMKALGFSQPINFTTESNGCMMSNTPRPVTTLPLARGAIPTSGTPRIEVETGDCSTNLKASAVANVNNGDPKDSKSLLWEQGDETDCIRRKEVEMCVSGEKEANQLGASRGKTEQIVNGFRICKPPGSFIWPSRMIPQTAGIHGFRTEDHLLSPSRLPPFMAQTSREDASAHVLFNITGSVGKDHFRPAFPRHITSLPRPGDPTFDKRSQPTAADHCQDSHRAGWMATERTQQVRAPGLHQPTLNQAPINPVGGHREPELARDGLTILSVAAGCEVSRKSCQGYDQEMEVTSQNKAPVLNSKCVSSSGASACTSTAVTASPELTSTYISQLIAARASRGKDHTFSPIPKLADQIECSQQVAAHAEQGQVAKTLFKGVRSTTLTQAAKPFPDAECAKNSTSTSGLKSKHSSWLGLAPPT